MHLEFHILRISSGLPVSGLQLSSHTSNLHPHLFLALLSAPRPRRTLADLLIPAYQELTVRGVGIGERSWEFKE